MPSALRITFLFILKHHVGKNVIDIVECIIAYAASEQTSKIETSTEQYS